MQFSKYTLDTFIAPKLSGLSGNNIPQVKCEFENISWLPNFILNSILVFKIDNKERMCSFNVLRKTNNAINEYETGRYEIITYLSENKERNSKYLKAIYHFENSISLSYQAISLLKTMNNIERIFEPSDKSLLQRVNSIYNNVKHLDERIEKGTLPEGYTTPLWLTNEGFESPNINEESQNIKISLDEFASLLKELGVISNKFVKPSKE